MDEIEVAKRKLFTNNVVGKSLEIKVNRRFLQYKVQRYDEKQGTHTVSPEAGTSVSVQPAQMDLNELALQGRIRTAESLIPRKVAQRWLAIAGGFRPDRGDAEGQRSDTPVAWPMPKGGNLVIN